MSFSNLSGIESAFIEDSSGMELASGEDEFREDESGSGSGAGMFGLFLTNADLIFFFFF